jgi:sugar phosphate isomerase/epimerase
MTGPTLGVTLYSFTPLFHARTYDLWQLIDRVAADDLGPGLEMVGFQAVRGFPVISRELERTFKDHLDSTGLRPTSLGANADAGLRRDRPLTEDELVEYMEAQLRAAARLGFPIVRMQYSVTPDLIERLLPVAEGLGVTMGMEIHSPHHVHHPVMRALLERYEKLSSPHLGFIPDWGASLVRFPPSMLATYEARGVSPELTHAIAAEWEADTTVLMDDDDQDRQFEHYLAIAQSLGGGDVAQAFAINAVALFGHQQPQDWAEILPWIVHVHGKFYDIDTTGDEPAVPYRELLRVLVAGGYEGSMSTEWEGWHWNRDSDPFEMVAAQQRLTRRLLAELAADRSAAGPRAPSQ